MMRINYIKMKVKISQIKPRSVLIKLLLFDIVVAKHSKIKKGDN